MWLRRPEATHGLSSTMAAATSSLATSVLRVVLMPLDAWQTVPWQLESARPKADGFQMS